MMKSLNEKPSNMGGSRNGRVLKEIKTPLSLPMVGGGAPPPHNNKNVPPVNRLNSNNNSNIRPVLSADSNMSNDVLKKRIRELEYENEQLKKHVLQAEKSIQNYRGFLSNKSTDRDTSRSIAVQTEDKSNSFENKYSSNNVRMSGLSIASSFTNNNSVQSSMELLGARKERDELRISLETLSSKYKIQENENVMLREQLTNSKIPARSIESIDLPQSESISIPLPKLDEFSPLISVRKHDLVHLYKQIQRYRVDMKELKKCLESELIKFQLSLEKEFAVKTKTCLLAMEHCSKKDYELTKCDMTSASVNTSPMSKSIRETSACATSPMSIVMPVQEVTCHSVSTMTSPEKNQTVNATGIISPNNSASENIESNGILCAFAHVPTTPMSIQGSQSILKLPKLNHSVELSDSSHKQAPPQDIDTNSKELYRIMELERELDQQQAMQKQQYDTMLKEYDTKVSNLMDQIITEREKANISRVNLGRAKEYFNNNYLVKAKSELDAIKRAAHVKDLMKVAAHREVSLEKDKMMNELVYKK